VYYALGQQDQLEIGQTKSRLSPGCMINMADLVVETLVGGALVQMCTLLQVMGAATHEVSHYMKHAPHPPQNKLLEFGTMQIP